MKRHDFTLATDGSGNATVTSADLAHGFVHEIRYVPDGSTPLATGADLTITAAGSGLAILTITDIGTVAAQFTPRQATCTTVGAASLYAAGGTAVTAPIALANERISVAVAQGGANKTGTLYIWVG
jgi:hypothetical protein